MKQLAFLFVLLLLPCACNQPRVATAEHGPCPFPTTIGMPIDEVKKRVSAHFKADEALDDVDEWVDQGPAWRQRTYVVEIPTVAPMVHYHYRDDGRVWAISVAHVREKYSGKIGDVDLGANVAHIVKTLGPASRSHTIAPILDEHVWTRGDLTYVVEAYNQTVEDIGAYGEPGDVTSILLYSRDLGPRGFVGYELPASSPSR